MQNLNTDHRAEIQPKQYIAGIPVSYDNAPFSSS
jgi:hypothetical protein